MLSSHTLKELSDELAKLNANILDALQHIQDTYNVTIRDVELFHTEEMGSPVNRLQNVTIWVSMS